MCKINNGAVYIKVGRGFNETINNSGKAKLICKNCFNVSDMGIDYSFNEIVSIQKTGNCDRSISYSSSAIPNIFTECKCKDWELTEHFICDEEIADIISTLNRKGFKTRYCCSGHSDDDRFYIMFDDVYPKLQNIVDTIGVGTLNVEKDQDNKDISLYEFISCEENNNYSREAAIYYFRLALSILQNDYIYDSLVDTKYAKAVPTLKGGNFLRDSELTQLFWNGLNLYDNTLVDSIKYNRTVLKPSGNFLKKEKKDYLSQFKLSKEVEQDLDEAYYAIMLGRLGIPPCYLKNKDNSNKEIEKELPTNNNTISKIGYLNIGCRIYDIPFNEAKDLIENDIHHIYHEDNFYRNYIINHINKTSKDTKQLLSGLYKLTKECDKYLSLKDYKLILDKLDPILSINNFISYCSFIILMD